MTVQEAKDILANDWWKRAPWQKEIFDIVVGSLIKETFENDGYFSNCFIINASLVKKGEQSTKETFDIDDDHWIGWAVAKSNGKCGIAIEIAGAV